jgi:hypothetical protein
MQRLLSFDSSPPLSVPLRFFLTAPVFSLAAASVLMAYGPSALESRWTAPALAITHLLVLGFLVMVMAGALIQILPVVAGISVAQVRLTAHIAHLSLAIGTVSLAGAFLSWSALWFGIAALILCGGLVWFVAACAWHMWNASDVGETLATVRWALFGLLVTVFIGTALAGALSVSLPLPFVELTNLHASWGLMGWIFLLVAGVGFQVVPMFIVTPVYPEIVTHWAGRLIIFLLLVLSAASLASVEQIQLDRIALALLALIGIAFSGVTMHLLWNRKRPTPDVPTRFWWVSMVCLMACGVSGLLASLMPGWLEQPAYMPLIGILFIVGFAFSVVNGMLYKIVPFLVWHHLQGQVKERTLLPNVKQIIGDQWAIRQWVAHLLAIGGLLASCVWPAAARVAGLLFALSSLMLCLNLAGAARVYRRVMSKQSAQQPG